MHNEKSLSIVGHLEELRRRIILCLVSVFVASFASFYFSGDILKFLSRPIEKLVFISPTEAFLIHIKIAMFAGLLVSLPVIIYQVWRFVAVGLMECERKRVFLYGPCSFLLFLAGAFFSFFVVVPIGLRFLLSFRMSDLEPMISVARYISFITRMVLVFGVVFQMPVVSIFLTRVGILTPKFLAEKRRYAILFVFIIAAILTPPDVISQMLLGLPMILLYEISIFFSKLVRRRN